jgi:hypothetical protein
LAKRARKLAMRRWGAAWLGVVSSPGCCYLALPQQIGLPFIIRQQVQPACSIAFMHSQQAWIIWQHLASPDVQQTLQPLSVMSQLHMPIVMLQQFTIMPFISMQQLTMPPAIIWQRFCIMLHAVASVQVQVMHMPSLVFSIFIVQRGTIIIFGIVPAMPAIGATPAPAAPIPIPAPIMPARSIIAMLVIAELLSLNEMASAALGAAGR